VFCDLVGSTGISSKLDAEDWRTWSASTSMKCSRAVIGLVGHVLKRLGDGLMALFRHDAAQENDAERTARHFDERGDKMERKGIRGEAFGPGNKRSRGRLLSRCRRRRSGARPASTELGGSGQLDAQPINAAISTLAVHAAGATPIAIAHPDLRRLPGGADEIRTMHPLVRHIRPDPPRSNEAWTSHRRVEDRNRLNPKSGQQYKIIKSTIDLLRRGAVSTVLGIWPSKRTDISCR
jgi:hypothetical protein